MDNVGTSAKSKYCVGLELCSMGKIAWLSLGLLGGAWPHSTR